MQRLVVAAPESVSRALARQPCIYSPEEGITLYGIDRKSRAFERLSILGRMVSLPAAPLCLPSGSGTRKH